MEISIPSQFQDEKFRFIKILKNTKDKGLETGYTTTKNYKYNDPILLDWIKDGNNYGILLGYGELRALDIDDKKVAERIIKEVKDMLITQTCGGSYHAVFKSPYDKNITVPSVGEYRAKNQYIVGPTCFAKAEKKGVKYEGYYKIIIDLPIKDLKEEETKHFISKYLKLKEDSGIDIDDIIPQRVVDKNFIHQNIFNNLSSDRMKELILLTGERGHRSEKDQELINSLLLMGYGDYIKSIFDNYPCGEKYREKGWAYLKCSIKAGMKYTGVAQIIVNELDFDFDSLSPKIIRNKSDFYLDKIALVDNSLTREHFLSRMAKITSISIKKLNERILEKNKVERVLYDWDDIDNLKVENFEYWCNPLLPKHSIIYLGGFAGSTKTLLQQIIMQSFRKNKFLFKTFQIENRPNILFYSLEMSLNQLARRQLYFKNGNVFENENFRDKKLKILDKFNPRNLKEEIETAKDYDIIFVDSYRRILEGDENSSEITNKLYTEFIKPLKDMGKTIVMIFHFNKMKFETYSPEEIMRAFRGSGDITAEPDIALGIFYWNEERTSSSKKFDISILIGKVRDDYPIHPFKLNLILDYENQKTLINEVSTKGVIPVILSPKQRRENKIIAVVKEKGEIETQELLNIVAHEFSCAKSSVEKDLKKLVTDGWIEKSAHGIYKIAGQEVGVVSELTLDDFDNTGEENLKKKDNLVKIKFIKVVPEWKKRKVGDISSAEEKSAENFVKQGFAVYIDEEINENGVDPYDNAHSK